MCMLSSVQYKNLCHIFNFLYETMNSSQRFIHPQLVAIYLYNCEDSSGIIYHAIVPITTKRHMHFISEFPTVLKLLKYMLSKLQYKQYLKSAKTSLAILQHKKVKQATSKQEFLNKVNSCRLKHSYALSRSPITE